MDAPMSWKIIEEGAEEVTVLVQHYLEDDLVTSTVCLEAVEDGDGPRIRIYGIKGAPMDGTTMEELEADVRRYALPWLAPRYMTLA